MMKFRAYDNPPLFVVGGLWTQPDAYKHQYEQLKLTFIRFTCELRVSCI